MKSTALFRKCLCINIAEALARLQSAVCSLMFIVQCCFTARLINFQWKWNVKCSFCLALDCWELILFKYAIRVLVRDMISNIDEIRLKCRVHEWNGVDSEINRQINQSWLENHFNAQLKCAIKTKRLIYRVWQLNSNHDVNVWGNWNAHKAQGIVHILRNALSVIFDPGIPSFRTKDVTKRLWATHPRCVTKYVNDP